MASQHLLRKLLLRVLQLLVACLLLFTLSMMIIFFIVSAPPRQGINEPNVIDDVTAMNPIRVQSIYQPQTVKEIMNLVSSQKGKISIGGARHSMGGQIGTENSIHLDMRGFDKVISFSKDSLLITVQTGITWRKIQEYVDGHDLSVMIMQTYADFTVGGSLSVNVHGRYIGHGPIIHSVKSIRVVLPDGRLINASRTENSEIFAGCIGGYGGLGVIVEATLRLEQNSRMARVSELMITPRYSEYFLRNIRNDSLVVFHNADIYPDEYNEVRAVSYVRTQKPVTIEDRLKPIEKDYRFERFAMWMVSEMPGGKWVRQHWGDPLYYENEEVCWRNYEASYNTNELEPVSREKSTYVLQEYFVPVDRLDSFVPKMASIFQEHDVNVINISIRHAHADTLSMLSWASTEVFCFVVYYKQGKQDADRKEVGVWTRKLIDAALNERGSFYLPYQIHATSDQFHRAYPNANEFFLLKRKLDPANKFTNKLWDKFYHADE
jgi:FAD/FMN-containing dehydrogenase